MCIPETDPNLFISGGRRSKFQRLSLRVSRGRLSAYFLPRPWTIPHVTGPFSSPLHLSVHPLDSVSTIKNGDSYKNVDSSYKSPDIS